MEDIKIRVGQGWGGGKWYTSIPEKNSPKYPKYPKFIHIIPKIIPRYIHTYIHTYINFVYPQILV